MHQCDLKEKILRSVLTNLLIILFQRKELKRMQVSFFMVIFFSLGANNLSLHVLHWCNVWIIFL